MIFLSDHSTMKVCAHKIDKNNIYAGKVITLKPFMQTQRKILFTKDSDGFTQDLLFDSPVYPLFSELKNKNKWTRYKGIINAEINLERLLEHYGFDDINSNKDIRKIYNLFLNPNSEFFFENHSHLPITNLEYESLKKLAELDKKPSQREKTANSNYSFKSKVKTYSLR